MNSKMDSVLATLHIQLKLFASGVDDILDRLLPTDLKENNDLIGTLSKSFELASVSLKDSRSSASAGAHISSLGDVIRETIVREVSRASVEQQVSLNRFKEQIESSLNEMKSSLVEQSVDNKAVQRSIAEIASVTSEMGASLSRLSADLAILKEDIADLGEVTRAAVATNQLILEKMSLFELESSRASAQVLTEIEKNRKIIDSLAPIVTFLPDLQTRMDTAQNQLNTLLTGSYDIPTLVIIFPELAKSGFDILRDPIKLVKNKYVMFFVCSQTYRLVPCGPKGQGYSVSVPKEWVKKAAPVLKVCLMAVKLGLMASGIPFPMAGMFDQLNQLDTSCHLQFMDFALNHCDNHEDDVDRDTEMMSMKLSDYNEDDIQSQISNVRFDSEETRAAYDTIKNILKDFDIRSTCGLSQVIHKGKVSWVIDDIEVKQAWMAKIDGKEDIGPQKTVEELKQVLAEKSASKRSARQQHHGIAKNSGVANNEKVGGSLLPSFSLFRR